MGHLLTQSILYSKSRTGLRIGSVTVNEKRYTMDSLKDGTQEQTALTSKSKSKMYITVFRM